MHLRPERDRAAAESARRAADRLFRSACRPGYPPTGSVPDDTSRKGERGRSERGDWCAVVTNPARSSSTRTDRVLDPAFTLDLERLDLPTLRARRREAEAEEQQLSYVRRIVQGRVDLLKAELERRAGHGGTLIPNLARILANEPTEGTRDNRHVPLVIPQSQAPSRGGVSPEPPDVGPDLQKLTDRELRGAMASLETHERGLSEIRARVHDVLGLLSQELTRRYREGSAHVDDLLTSVRRP